MRAAESNACSRVRVLSANSPTRCSAQCACHGRRLRAERGGPVRGHPLRFRFGVRHGSGFRRTWRLSRSPGTSAFRYGTLADARTETLHASEPRRFVRDRESRNARRTAAVDMISRGWISFWNDLLRNDEGVNYYSETSSRKSISPWLLSALTTNAPDNRFVEQLLNPATPDDPDGFLIGVNWRGVVNASQTPAMQAVQNSARSSSAST